MTSDSQDYHMGARASLDPHSGNLSLSPDVLPCLEDGSMMTGADKNLVVAKLKSSLFHENVHFKQRAAGRLPPLPKVPKPTLPLTRPSDGTNWDEHWRASSVANNAWRMVKLCSYIDYLPLEQEAHERQHEKEKEEKEDDPDYEICQKDVDGDREKSAAYPRF